MQPTTPTTTVIRLRRDRFDQRARELKLGTMACADYIGVDRGTLSRILNGEGVPGERFIAACLSSGFAPSFEFLFRLAEAS